MSDYPYSWRSRRRADLVAAGYECERCAQPDRPMGRYTQLERAHLDGDRNNDAPQNIAVLCRTCHRRHDYAAWARQHAEWRLRERERRIARKDAARPILAQLMELIERGQAAQAAVDRAIEEATS
jgi:hypothetical protein